MNWYKSAFSSPQDSSKWGLIAIFLGVLPAFAFSRLVPGTNFEASLLIIGATIFSIRMRISLSKFPIFWISTAIVMMFNFILIYELRHAVDVPKIALFPVALFDVLINNAIYLFAQFVTGTQDV